jgi:hypothetical protein
MHSDLVNNSGQWPSFWSGSNSLTMLFQRKDVFYCLVVDWALLGILIKRLAVDTIPDQNVLVTAIAGLFLITLGVIVQIIRRRVY